MSMYAPGPGICDFETFLLHSLSLLEPNGTLTASSMSILVLMSSFFLSKLYFPGPGFSMLVGFV